MQRRVLEHALRDFRLAGVGLGAADKQRFKEVMLELTGLQAKFEENVLDATNGWSYRVSDEAVLRGLNEMLIDQARRRAHDQGIEGWILTLDQPTYVAVATDAESDVLRRAFYEAWTTRASDQGPNAGKWDNAGVMEQILRKRYEAARILGFGNYAEYALATRMAHSVSEVMQFLDELSRSARPAAVREFEELEAFAGRKLEAWDVGFYAERLQRERYAVSQEELRPYFPLPRVLAGLFEVAERLFDLRIQRAQRRSGVAPGRALFRDRERRRDGQSAASISMRTRGPTSAAARGWTSASGASDLATGSALPTAYLVCNVLPRAKAGRRCSRTTTC